MKYIRIAFDIETRSHYDLKGGDAWLYSRHHTTGINSMVLNWCAKPKCSPSLASKDYLLLDYYDCTDPKKLDKVKRIFDSPEVLILCHNAPFEMYVLENVLGWKYPPSKFICTMAKAAYYHLPQSLDGVAKALGLPILKDMGAGSKAMKELMKCDSHGKHITALEKPELFKDLYSYNVNDTDVTLLADKALPDLPAEEREVWNLHFEINRRGIPLDWFLIENARQIVKEETADLDAETFMITGGKVNSTRQTKELAKYFGLKSVSAQALDDFEESFCLNFNDPETTVNSRLVEIRRQVGLSSLAKFDAMDASMDTDRRIRDTFWYYGAHPGRWSGKGAQPQNLVNQYDESLCEALAMSDQAFVKAFYAEPLVALQGAVRGAVYSGEDATFLGVDLKQIEARAAAWIGGDQRTLDHYAAGRDVYCETASALYGRTITKADNPLERDTGKRVELLCQFGGGIGGLERTFKKNGVDIEQLTTTITPTNVELASSSGGMKWYYDHGGCLPEDQALTLEVLKLRWRAAHPEICQKWNDLERGFIAGIYNDGKIKIQRTAKGSRILTLASGRQMFYRNVITSGNNISYEGRYGREEIYGAMIFQNGVQATDRDVIVFYMRKVNPFASIILHCHDEYIAEIADAKLEEVERKINAVHHVFPNWSLGLPIDYEVWKAKRYAK